MAEKRGWIRSPIVGIVIGVLAGGLVVLLLESVGHAMFGTADPQDLASVTTPMFLSVLVAWIVGSAAGGAVATYWSRSRSIWPGALTGVVFLAFAISNMFVIPHPLWMIVAAVVLMPLATLLAARRLCAANAANAPA